MVPSRRFGVVAASVGLALVSSATGCSSADFQTAAPIDAGDAGDSGDDTARPVTDSAASLDTAPGCVVPPVKLGGEAEFCNTVAYIFSRCGQCEACRQTDLNDCVAFGDTLSDGVKQALVACRDTVACGDYKTYFDDPCVRDHVLKAGLDPQQLAARTEYCAKCPSNAYECENFFGKKDPADAGADAGTAGIGVILVVASDPVAKSIVDGCSGGINCNPTVYELCSAGKFCGAVAPDACKSGFCGK